MWDVWFDFEENFIWWCVEVGFSGWFVYDVDWGFCGFCLKIKRYFCCE